MGEGGEEEGGVFDPGIHLAFMVWRRLSSPLNFVFRWREPKRWEGECGAGVMVPPHLGGTCVRTERGKGVNPVSGYQRSVTSWQPDRPLCPKMVTCLINIDFKGTVYLKNTDLPPYLQCCSSSCLPSLQYDGTR